MNGPRFKQLQYRPDKSNQMKHLSDLKVALPQPGSASVFVLTFSTMVR
jgi:hypothetical protein